MLSASLERLLSAGRSGLIVCMGMYDCLRRVAGAENAGVQLKPGRDVPAKADFYSDQC